VSPNSIELGWLRADYIGGRTVVLEILLQELLTISLSSLRTPGPKPLLRLGGLFACLAFRGTSTPKAGGHPHMENSIEVPAEQKQDKGFTLVELLIVIVILGILATVTVFAVRGITDQGKTSACEADQKTMETAVEAYFAQNGSSTITAPAETTLVTAGFLRSESAKFDVSSSGALTAVTGSGCTV
jgi:prepilin-type N-terminal cleavage/methylation domain-containing protein